MLQGQILIAKITESTLMSTEFKPFHFLTQTQQAFIELLFNYNDQLLTKPNSINYI